MYQVDDISKRLTRWIGSSNKEPIGQYPCPERYLAILQDTLCTPMILREIKEEVISYDYDR
jgi:hypothetical protein